MRAMGFGPPPFVNFGRVSVSKPRNGIFSPVLASTGEAHFAVASARSSATACEPMDARGGRG